MATPHLLGGYLPATLTEAVEDCLCVPDRGACGRALAPALRSPLTISFLANYAAAFYCELRYDSESFDGYP
jgi:hypothetical protein